MATMNQLELYLLPLLTLMTGLAPFFLYFRFQAYRSRWRSNNEAALPPVTVVLPCKGTDNDFEENLKSILDQDYPQFEVVFVTATADDDAIVPIEKVRQRSQIPTQLLVAGISPYCGQKMGNMICGVRNASLQSEVLVFVDGDVRAHRQFLRAIVSPLANQNVGATCGFPIPIPEKGRLGSLLRTVWSIGGLLTLADRQRCFAIGASTAMRRSVYQSTNLEERLARTVSDTFAFTRAVREAGLDVVFVPAAVSISIDNSSVRDMWRWSTRLTILSRVYSRPFWWLVTTTYSASTLIVVLGIISAISGGSIGAWSALTLIALQVISGYVAAGTLISLIRANHPREAETISRHRLAFAALTPITTVIIFLNSVVSVLTNTVEWRGIRYRLISAEETRVE